MTRTGVYPGSFNPPTVAHLAIAEAACHQRGLARVDLAISVAALDKEHVSLPLLEHRIEVLERTAASRDWLGVLVTEAQLIVDIADGYDLVVMGADKWHQVLDPRYYGDSAAARDEAFARLPDVAVAPRPPLEIPPERALVLPEELGEVSSSAVRDGTHHWMAPEAAAFDADTGAWSDPTRYRTWLDARSD
ncbi:MAG: hypothetical protein S0880_22235 [Actinomycetota bacterium]|nr:hypothetical protein [Actinomycetota bacterium]